MITIRLSDDAAKHHASCVELPLSGIHAHQNEVIRACRAALDAAKPVTVKGREVFNGNLYLAYRLNGGRVDVADIIEECANEDSRKQLLALLRPVTLTCTNGKGEQQGVVVKNAKRGEFSSVAALMFTGGPEVAPSLLARECLTNPENGRRLLAALEGDHADA